MSRRFSLEKEDLLAAFDARIRQEIRPVFRYLLLGFGALWFFGGLFTLFDQGLSLRVLFYLITGACVLWKWFLVPAIQRRRIRAEPQPALRVAFSLDENRIVLAAGQGIATYEWSDVCRVTPTRKGVLLDFQDGTSQWLPKRAIGDGPSWDLLISFLRSR